MRLFFWLNVKYEDCEHFLCFLLAFVESVSVSQFQLEVCGEIMNATSKFGPLPLFQLKDLNM